MPNSRRPVRKQSDSTDGSCLAMVLLVGTGLFTFRNGIENRDVGTIFMSLLFLGGIAAYFVYQHGESDRQRQAARAATESRARQFRTVQQLYSMTPGEFEQYVADLFSLGGHQAQVVGRSGDQGVDVLLEVEGRKIAIQTKLYSGTVGNDAVSQVYAGKALYGADEAWVIATSHFSASAKQLAQATGVRLIDGNELGGLIEKLRTTPEWKERRQA